MTDQNVISSQPGIDEVDTVSAPKETREIVTPYAFKVSDELLGQPLATPLRRAIAQAIDLILVAMLSTANAFILAVLVSLTFFKAGNNLAHRARRARTRKILRLLGACMLFFVTFLVVEAYNDINRGPEASIKEASSIAKPLLNGLSIVAWRACKGDFECQKNVAKEFGATAAETDADESEVKKVVTGLYGMVDLTNEQEATLTQLYMEAFRNAKASEKKVPETAHESVPKSVVTLSGEPVKSDPDSPSVIAWLKGIAQDLGLGFGWAALYYSVFTAWWKGTTPGKRLCGIRVLKLDGSSLTLWESFGRYGGYGAGLATGLLGFIQIFWDPNRQAIQDKISETLVLRQSRELNAITKGKALKENTAGEGI